LLLGSFLVEGQLDVLASLALGVDPLGEQA
jgi:hypothetical protein